MPPDIPGAIHHIPPRPGAHPSESMSGQSIGPKNNMLSFKQFLAQQDDSIDEGQAIQLYQEYKSDFKRKQITDFFDEHKEEDWLISKYHPKHILSREEAQKTNLQSRLKSFVYLLESGRLDKVPISAESADDIISTMDAGVILMEGGSDHDLLSLVKSASGNEDSKIGEERLAEEVIEDNSLKEDMQKSQESIEDSPRKDKPLFMEVTDEQRQLAQQARMYGEQMQALSESVGGKKKRVQKNDDDQYSYTGDRSDGSSEEETEALPDEPPPPGLEPPSTDPATNSESAANTAQKESSHAHEHDNVLQDMLEVKNSSPPQPLHITRSVYIRHLPPKIAAEDIVEICRTLPGYLRIAFADPDPNRGFERRGWVTYSHNTDIREVTARLTTNKVKGVQLNCMVNRELTRRVKFGQEIAWASRAVHCDLHNALTLVKSMDERAQLWEHCTVDSEDKACSCNIYFSVSW
jgi:hypothetical protein